MSGRLLPPSPHQSQSVSTFHRLQLLPASGIRKELQSSTAWETSSHYQKRSGEHATGSGSTPAFVRLILIAEMSTWRQWPRPSSQAGNCSAFSISIPIEATTSPAAAHPMAAPSMNFASGSQVQAGFQWKRLNHPPTATQNGPAESCSFGFPDGEVPNLPVFAAAETRGDCYYAAVGGSAASTRGFPAPGWEWVRARRWTVQCP